MRVVVDARWTRTDYYDGVGRYGAGLIEALHRLHPVTMLIHDQRQLRLLPSGVPYVRVNSPLSVRELFLAGKLNRLGADVVFTPLQIIGGFRRRYKLIRTVHDLIYYRYPRPPSFLPLPVRILWWLYHRVYWPQRVLLNRSDAVVAVSRTTKKLIIEHRLTKRPVIVVHNAPPRVPARSDGASQPAHVDDSGGPRELVYMGSFMPYKNVETLIRGMAALPGYRLHLLSRLVPSREVELSALIPPGADVVFWRGVGDSEYHELLARATALVTASKDEGFGIPIVEAMNIGTPVVCSDLPIFREVTGNHALFFDPDSFRSFAATVCELEDVRARSELVGSARRHVEGFTWTSSARRLLDLMRSLVED